MKQYKLILALILILFSTIGFSQSSIGLTGSNANAVDDDRLHLAQYLWGYSKNKSAQSEELQIDFNTINNWRGLGNYLSVSDNGEFFAYTINKPSSDFRYSLMSLNELDSLVVQSTHNSWRLAFASPSPGFFTDDSKQYIFLDKETLFFLQLGKAQSRSVKDIASFKVSQNKWLAYLSKGRDGLTLQDLATGKEKYFPGVKDYAFDNSGGWLNCQTNSNELLVYNLATGTDKRYPSVATYLFATSGNSLLLKTTTNLQYISLPQGDAKTIWSVKEKTGIGSYVMDDAGKQVVFSVYDSTDNKANIWYYNTAMDKAVLKVTNETPGISEGLTIMGAVSFTDNGRYIKLSLQAKPEVFGKPEADIAGLEIWNHKDMYLQSTQSKRLKWPEQFNAIVNVENGKVTLSESDGKTLYLLQADFAIVKKSGKEAHGDRFWEKGAGFNEDSNWVVSLKDGSSHLLPTKAGSGSFWFSPGGNYLVFFDADKGSHYFSYNLHSGILKDISANVLNGHLGFVHRYKRTGEGPVWPAGLAAWLANDIGVLVYDNYDIWRLDLTGKEPAINITNGLGQSNNIMFNLLTTHRFYGDKLPVIKPDESLLLRTFNTKNKKCGFYQKADIHSGTLKLLYIGNYFINSIGGCHDPNLSNKGIAPVKAKNRDTWIVQRQSATDAPNYYETKDLKKFRRLTNFQPQKDYQWLSEELVSFKHLDGKTGQGLLYKPEDFDPRKKYPVLIVFYGAFSNNFHQFPIPTGNSAAISPGSSPLWFLNNGYLVFTPDMYVAPLKYGPETFNVIEGAAKYLQQLPYVNANKLGCAAHSWSSKLGAYVFTHSSSFAATTISGCATYNPIANVLSPIGHGLEDLEVEQEWGSLWENKDAWLDLTAVLQADKAKGAMLLLENKESSPVYQDQAFQFFTALRRLNKNAWWLKYYKGGHTLGDPKEIKDYTIRYTQFFDHYLKNAPAPLWMTEGVPSKLKGIESRHELDPKGTCNATNGEPCLICQAWNAQYKRTPEMFQKEIKDWVLDTDIATELERKLDERRKQLDKEGEIQRKEVLRKLKAR